jgi:hypothetical protein
MLDAGEVLGRALVGLVNLLNPSWWWWAAASASRVPSWWSVRPRS